MPNQLAEVTSQINVLLEEIERGANPDIAQLEETLTDGYAWALSLDAECSRLERQISENAENLDHGSTEKRARELSVLARRLAGSRRDLESLRGLLATLRTGVQEAKVA
jgi:paraquat-inducible protein B